MKKHCGCGDKKEDSEMDPNETLWKMMELAKEVMEKQELSISRGSVLDYSVEARDLAEGIQNLDGWICNGGFLPERWTKK